jgi:hypothetical protein
MLMDFDLKGKEYSFFYLLGRSLQRWNIAIIFLFFMVLQSVGYIKAFINMHRSKEVRLRGSCKGPWTYLTCFSSVGLIIYFFRLLTILL